jgi:hypothetical protein
MLPNGKAVSPIAAAHCLLEPLRTTKFIRGIYKAVLQLQETFKGEQLHILYAGCGPYATLLTSLTEVFSPKEISFHLMDINPTSLDAAKQLYKALGLEAYIAEYLLEDACAYKIPQGQTIHMVVSETMLNALKNEPQVAITLNLLPQLPKGGLFIPQSIQVSAVAVNRRSNFECMFDPTVEPIRETLGIVYDIGQANCSLHQPVSFALPADDVLNELRLFTDIYVYQDEVLTLNQCSLNLPVTVCEIDNNRGKTIRFKYQMGAEPGFEHEFN